MITTRNLMAEELLTTFTVLKVHYEPHAESEWTLQFEDYPPIVYLDKYLQTREGDEKLVGKKIKAQIHLEVSNEDLSLITDFKEQKKLIIDVPSSVKMGDYVPLGSIIVTGIYKDDIKDVDYESVDSFLDSIFKLKITKNLGSEQLGFKKGDWIKIKTYERCIDMARDYMPLEEENSVKM